MGDTDRKYPSWGQFLKQRRLQRFRSAREFCTKQKVGISYPQYSRYESGEQLPNLDQALRICSLLDIPTLEGLLEWSRAQINDETMRSEVEGHLEKVRLQASRAEAQEKAQPSREGSQEPSGLMMNFNRLNDVLVFNRSHLKIFSSDPAYRDIFTYVNSYSPDWIRADELSMAVGQPQDKVEKMLDQLSDLGVVLLAGGRCRAAKKVFYFPDDADFFELRNHNFMHNAQQIVDRVSFEQLKEERAYRGLITRELTDEQATTLKKEIDALIRKMNTMSETENPDKIYSLCVLMGERFSRKQILDELDKDKPTFSAPIPSPEGPGADIGI